MAAALAATALPPAHANGDDAGAEGRLAVIDTGSGRIVIEFFADDAPGHVDNFVSLAESGFYDGTVFHRLIPGFMIQGGDPNTRQADSMPRSTWGMGGPEWTVDAEFNDIRHDRGIVSMARSASPDSAGSQFFIVHSNSNFLDGQYTAFGRVVTADSLDTLDAIALLPTDERDAPEEAEPAVIRSVVIVDRDAVDGVDDLGEPARISQPIGPPAPPPTLEVPDSGTYASDEFGVAFDVPDGWFLQRTGETGDFFPDLVLMGPAPLGGQPQAITVSVDPRNGTALDAMLDEHDRQLEEAIEAGQLEITSKEMITVGGVDARQTDAISSFEFAGGQSVSVQFKEIALAGTDDFYIITYSSLSEQFADSEDDFDRVVESFMAAGIGEGGGPADGGDGAGGGLADQLFALVETNGTSAGGGNQSGGGGQGGGCLVATAAYGTELAPQVQLLREVRDVALAPTAAGSAFMGAFNAVYYAFSPAVADFMRDHPAAAHAARIAAAPLLSILSVVPQADGQPEWQVVALAAPAAALAVGAYVAAPAAAAAAVAPLLVRRRPRPQPVPAPDGG